MQFDKDVRVGDLREGASSIRIRVRVLSIDAGKARCLLVRSGKEKDLSVATLQKAYYLVERAQ